MDQTAIAWNDVEPLESIFKRLDSAGISLGAFVLLRRMKPLRSHEPPWVPAPTPVRVEDPPATVPSAARRSKQIAQGRLV